MRREVCKLNRGNCVSAVTWYSRDSSFCVLVTSACFSLPLPLCRLVCRWRLLVSVSWGKCSSLLRDPKQINTHYNLITSPPQHTQQQIITLICVCLSNSLLPLHLNYWSAFPSVSLLKWTPYPMMPPTRSLKAK